MNGGAKCLPDAPIPFVFFEHSFGVELQPEYAAMARVVERLDQAIFGMSHGLKMNAQAANTLVVIAVYLELVPVIPGFQRAAGDDANRVTVVVIMFAGTDVF